MQMFLPNISYFSLLQPKGQFFPVAHVYLFLILKKMKEKTAISYGKNYSVLFCQMKQWNNNKPSYERASVIL